MGRVGRTFPSFPLYPCIKKWIGKSTSQGEPHQQVRLIEFPGVIRGGAVGGRERAGYLCRVRAAPFGSAIMRARRTRPRQGRKEGEREEGAQRQGQGASTVDSSWPRHYRGCSFFFLSAGPSLLSHSLISFGHPSNSLFFSLRLPSLSLPPCSRRRGLFLSLSSTSFGLSCQPISSHPIWTGIKMEGSYQ